MRTAIRGIVLLASKRFHDERRDVIRMMQTHAGEDRRKHGVACNFLIKPLRQQLNDLRSADPF